MPDILTWLAFGTQACVFVAAAFSAYQSVRNKAAITEVHLMVNSRLTEFKETSERLLSASVEAAHAEGVVQGKEEKMVQKNV